MNSIKIIIPLLAAVVLVGCDEDQLKKLKEERDGKVKDRLTLTTEIDSMNKLIAEMDTMDTTPAKTILINTTTVATKNFEHYIEVQGIAESRANILISAEMAGMVSEVLVKEGQRVSAGQVLARLDASIMNNSVAEVNTALDLAETVYMRQKALWDQNIGSEIQYLQAKNQKESLEKKLATLQSQVSKMTINAPISGTVDQTFVKKGEMAMPGSPVARVVNLDNVFVVADVSESYVGAINSGDKVMVSYPNLGMEAEGKVSAVSNFINPNNRTFRVEVDPGKDLDLKPNLLGLIQIRDFNMDSVPVVPTKYIRQDSEGSFVFLVKKNGGDKVATQSRVKTGRSFDGETVIMEGVNAGDIIVTDGHMEVQDKDLVSVKN